MKCNPTPRRRFRTLRGGFTLIELLVAISILSIMLFLINIVFVQTTQAVSTGVRQSNILAVARSTNDRIARDASAMLGPNSQNPAPEGGGYIVIINHRIVAPVKRMDGTERLESFRVDQLVFMASAEAAASKVNQFRAAAPRDGSQYGSDYASPFALVRYGHGRRTERNGNDITTWTELGFDRGSGLDFYANDWMFTRQAVLFNPTDRVTNTLQFNLDNGVPDWHVQAPFVGALIQNEASNNAMAAGYCDVTNLPPSAPMTNAVPGFVDQALDPSNPGLNAATIEANYLALTNIFDRLRVNPIPNNTDFEAVRVGQLHGIFAPNCSEFIVQFAADANNDGEVDRVDAGGGNTGTEANGDPIYWYDYESLFADPWAVPGDWGGTTVPSPIVDVSASNHGTTAFIFRYEDDQAYTESSPGVGDADNSKWPYLIRIRYRLHDAPGKIEGNATFRRTDGFSNDDDNGDGVIDGTDDIDEPDEQFVSGQYFEQIIRVPRPQ